MKALSLSTAILFAFTPLTASAITIDIGADMLKDANGAPMAQTGVVVLTAAPGGAFGGPSGSYFVTGSEVFLYSWDLSALSTDGAFAGSTGDLALNPGDELRLYWYPTLTLADSIPAVGIPYGFYSDPLGVDGSEKWIIAEAEGGLGTNMQLYFLTSDSEILPGSNAPEAGIASHRVPDTGGTLALMSIGLLGLSVVRRFGKSRHRR